MNVPTVRRIATFTALAVMLILAGALGAQTRDKRPNWPSPHGAKDQARTQMITLVMIPLGNNSSGFISRCAIPC
jgi:hypothetical protein